MYLTTIVFGVILLVSLWQGYKAGFIRSLAKVLAWILSYPAAIFFTRPGADFLLAHTAMQGLIVYFAAGGFIFIITSVLITKLADLYLQFSPISEKYEQTSRISGAVLGGIVGGIVGLLVGYAVDIAKTPAVIAVNKTADASVAKKEIYYQVETDRETLVDKAAKKMVSAVAAKAVDMSLHDAETTQFTKTITENPQFVLEHVKAVATNGELNQFLLNKDVQKLLDAGDKSALKSSEAFQALMANPHMAAIMKSSGMQGDANAEDFFVDKLTSAWQRKDAIRKNPQVMAILADAEVQKQLTNPNKLPLLMNPKIRQLVDTIFAEDEKSALSASMGATAADTETEAEQASAPTHARNKELTPANLSADTPTTPSKPIYQWKDDQGVVHFSDSAPDKQ